MFKLNVQGFKVCNEVVGNRGISWCALITDDGALTYEIVSSVGLRSYVHLYDAEAAVQSFEFYDNDGVLSVQPKVQQPI